MNRYPDAIRYMRSAALAGVVTWFTLRAWIAAAPLAYLDPEYPAWRAKMELLRRCDLGQMVILGDSRAAVDVIPALLPIPATNLAVGGGKPVEAFAALKRMLACPNPPRRVLIALDPAHFMKPDLFWERAVRFGFVSYDDLSELTELSRGTNDPCLLSPMQPDGLDDAWRARMYAVRFPTLYIGSVIRGAVFLRWWRNAGTLADTLESRGQYFFGTAPGSDIVAVDGHLDRFEPSPILDRYFDRLLATLQQHGIAADFVAMPVNEATDAAITPALRSGYAAYLAGYEARYPGFRVIGPPMRHWPDRMFGDAFSHLNPDGARLFSTWLADCLRREWACAEPNPQPRLQAAPPSTQNLAQWGWLRGTGRAACARVGPSSKRSS